MLLPAERHRAIVRVVNTRGSVRVRELSHMFDVTEETVRRDLGSLENEGKLRRSHGGALRVKDKSGDEVSYLERESEHVTEKRSIALRAVQSISAGDHVALDASTTAWNVALAMPDIPITVVTNSLKIASELSSRGKMEVVTVGGIVRSSSLSCVGPMVEDALSAFHVSKAFVSCEGMHTEYGLSESDALQALVKRKMIEIADTVVVLADHSKIQVRGFKSVAEVNEVHVIITDENTPEELVKQFEKHEVEVVRAYMTAPIMDSI